MKIFNKHVNLGNSRVYSSVYTLYNTEGFVVNRVPHFTAEGYLTVAITCTHCDKSLDHFRALPRSAAGTKLCST